MAVGERLKLVNCCCILTDDSVNVIMLHVNLALQKLNTGANEVLKTFNYGIVAKGGLHELEVVSGCLRISVC